MARLARIVAPGLPHHVTARGNRREPIFFEDGDQEVYLDLLAEQLRKAHVACWAYCLMPNNVHLILCPPPPMASPGRWVPPIADGPISSTLAAAGAAICSTGASPRWRWTRIT